MKKYFNLLKYDSLSNIFALIIPLIVLYNITIYPLTPSFYRSLGVLFACLIVFLKNKPKNRLEKYFTVIIIFLSIITFLYSSFKIEDIADGYGIYTTRYDVFFTFTGILIILEATRRTIGNALPIIAIIFLSATKLGQFLPGPLRLQEYSISRVTATMFGFEGIFGIAIAVALTYVVIFLILGSFLKEFGTGEFLIDLANAISGKGKGGPAKVATIASCLFGSISGSAVANVAGTGTFTIPLMKSTGYSPVFSAAVEAAASTGGLFMPPVMAAGAFIMADILGVSYLFIIKSSFIPAIIYFLTIWLVIDGRARYLNLKALSNSNIKNLKDLIFTKGIMLIPIFVLLYFLVIIRYSPAKSGFFAIVASLFIYIIFIEKKPLNILKSILSGLRDAGIASVFVILPCACAGIVIGVIGLTGFGQKVASLLISVGGSSLFVMLFLSMITAIIFGMALPVTVSYLICITILGPTLIMAGILPIAAHLFVFYFAALSGITPPVAMASFTAAGIAGAPITATSLQAIRIAISGFLLPYIFVYNTNLILQTNNLILIIQATIQAILVCFLMSIALEGYFLMKLRYHIRFIFFISSILLINKNYPILNLMSLLVFLTTILYLVYKNKKRKSY